MTAPTPIAFRRCFVAWMLPAEAVQQVDVCREQWTWPAAARAIGDGDLHVTLHYIGDLDAARLAAVRQALRVVRVPEVDVCLGTAEVWKREVAVLYGDATPQMQAVQQVVGNALALAGCSPDGKRPWRPHITLARHAAGADAPASPRRVQWRTSGIVLAASASAGPRRYQIVDEWPST
jgi:2'-5' RNA ligase